MYILRINVLRTNIGIVVGIECLECRVILFPILCLLLKREGINYVTVVAEFDLALVQTRNRFEQVECSDVPDLRVAHNFETKLGWKTPLRF